jgi:urease alpha subunit
MKRWNMLVGTLYTGLLCACAAPPYEPASADHTARVHFVNIERPSICISGQRFALTPEDGGNVSVPAGQPVHLLGAYRRHSGHCFPAIKFVPQAGQTYDVVNDVRAERCIVNVMRHDASAQYGLRVEPSVNATSICPR